MMLLVDTNIFLEVILEQEKSKEASIFLSNIEKHIFFISDYSLHSIGLLLFHRKQHKVFLQFVEDMIIDAGMSMLSLSEQDMEYVINSAQKFNLDFDDAYQYTIAKKYDLDIVSFDKHFELTDLGRKLPTEII